MRRLPIRLSIFNFDMGSMMWRDVIRLCAKLGLFVLPVVVLIAVFAYKIESPTDTKRALIADKVQRLLVAYPEQPKVIFAGESRAETGLRPDVFQELTGLHAVNVAVGLGSLNEMYDALLAAGQLNQRRLIVVSVTSYEINDRHIDDQINNVEIAKTMSWGRDKLQYISDLLSRQRSFYVNRFGVFLRGKFTNGSHMSDMVFGDRGYVRNEGVFDLRQLPTVDSNSPIYRAVATGGVKERDFVRAIRGFGATNDTVVILIGPISPAWRVSIAPVGAPAVERNFVRVIQEAIAPHPSMHFIDYSGIANEPPPFTNDDFADAAHVHVAGAQRLTTLLVESLRTRALLPR